MGNAGALNPKGFSILLRIQHWYKPYSSELGEQNAQYPQSIFQLENKAITSFITAAERCTYNV